MKTEKDKMIAGELYRAGDDNLVSGRQNAKRLNRLFNGTTELELDKRQDILNELLIMTDKPAYIEPPFRCDYGYNISLGDNFYANYDNIFLDICPITIGNDVMFGPRVSLYTATHPIDATIRNSGLELGKPIVIGDNVWLGGNTVVNPGVSIGNNVIVGSGSVITKNLPDNVIAAGNPCRVIREITADDQVYWEAKAAEYEALKAN